MSQAVSSRTRRPGGMVYVDDPQEQLGLSDGGSVSPGSDKDKDSDYAEIDSDDSYHSEGEDLVQYWDPYLYQLQMKAPRPHCISCLQEVPDRPSFFGDEYHGSITREETGRMLGKQEGNYLVRQGLSQPGSYSLSFVFGGQVRHYRLFHEGQNYFVGEKPFETVEDLVHDGLITLYMEANNVDEYLRTARESRGTAAHNRDDAQLTSEQQQRSSSAKEDEGVFSEESHTPPPPPPPLPPRNRHSQYHPCTIPGKKDSVSLDRSSKEHPVIAATKEALAAAGSLVSSFDAQDEDSSCMNNGIQKHRKDSSLYFHYEKPHNFKIHSYLGIMPWCDFCRNFMWGLRVQGYRCKDCGYNAHKQCKDEVAHDCQPSRQLVKRVYGVELTTLVKMHGTKLPVVVKDCIQEIESRELTSEGLYRVSGKNIDILTLKKQFDEGSSAELKTYEDVNAITGALKLYLRELPIPLLTFDAYDICLIAARTSSRNESVEMLKVALSRLPPPHFNTLKHLIKHLVRVQENRESNRMDAKNLATVFSPSIMRSRAYNPSSMEAMQKIPEQKKVVELLISYYNDLFETQ